MIKKTLFAVCFDLQPAYSIITGENGIDYRACGVIEEDGKNQGSKQKLCNGIAWT